MLVRRHQAGHGVRGHRLDALAREKARDQLAPLEDVLVLGPVRPDLEREVNRLGNDGRLFGFHVCDWKTDTRHLLLDRGLMGDGVIDLRRFRAMMENAGFDGMIEVEVFNEDYWAMDQDTYLALIRDRVLTCV